MANPDIYGGWEDHEGLFDKPEGSALSDAGVTQDFPDVSFTPDVAGEYVFYFNAGDGDEYREGKWTVTVTGEAEEPTIDSSTVANISFKDGLSGSIIDDELLANFRNVEAYVGTWKDSDWEWAADALPNEAVWPAMKFSYPADDGAILRLHFLP